jgi:predicted permease
MNDARSWWRRLFKRGEIERELDAELRYHFERKVAEYAAGGKTEAEARRLARLEFGGLEQVKEACRDARGTRWIEDALQDVRYALRGMRRSPGFTAVAVLSLALGIGANSGVFSLMDQALHRFLPVREPQRLVLLHLPAKMTGMSRYDGSATVVPLPFYAAIAQRGDLFDAVFARSSAAVVLTGGETPERATAEIVSGNYFEALGVDAAVGRLLTPADARAPGEQPVIVLSHDYWERRFQRDPAVLHRTLRINNFPMTVAGVAAPGFRGVLTGQSPDLFVPVTMHQAALPTVPGLESMRVSWLNVFARLRPGVTRERTEAMFHAVYRGLVEELLPGLDPPPPVFERERLLQQRPALEPAGQGLRDFGQQWERPLLTLFGMTGLVVLIACVNVANLLLTRGAGRRREFGIRLAVGAGGFRLVRQQLIECLVLAITGGIAALLLAHWTASGLVALLPASAANGWLSASVDLRMLAFHLAITMLCGLACGLLPAWHAGRLARSLTGTLKVPGGAAGSASQAWFRRSMVAAQVALSLVLLVGAGLFARSLYSLRHHDPGFQTGNVTWFEMNPRLSGYERERMAAFYEELLPRLRALPGVTAAGASTSPPLADSATTFNITVDGPMPEGEGAAVTHGAVVSPGYFETLGIRLLAGRDFGERDRPGAPQAVIVNQAFARHFFPDADPAGRRIGFGSGNTVRLEYQVVGVVSDSSLTLRGEPPRLLYTALRQRADFAGMTFLVRTAPGSPPPGAAIRAAVQAIDPNLPVFRLQSMSVRRDEQLFRERILAVLAGGFATVAALLAAVGLFGVVSYWVAERRGEIAIRMALGAQRAGIMGMVVRQGFAVVAVGLLVGIVAAVALGRAISGLLFGVTPADPLTFAVLSLALMTVALLACYLPARRAAKVDPMIALRHE